MLKAIGYTDRFVLGLVLAESVLIALVGGSVGLWLAHGLAAQDITQGLILLYLPTPALVELIPIQCVCNEIGVNGMENQSYQPE